MYLPSYHHVLKLEIILFKCFLPYHVKHVWLTWILVSHNNLQHTLPLKKSLTPLMWALLHGAYPVVEEHVDPSVAAHCIVALMPFPFLSCFLSLGCPLLVAVSEGRSSHQKSRGRMDRTQREMWTSVDDPWSSRTDRGKVKSCCRVQNVSWTTTH